MSKKVLVLTAVVLFFSAPEVQADVIHSTWVGLSQGSWNQTSNWNPNVVPDNDGNIFTVIIDSNSIGADNINVGLEQSRHVSKLDCYGEVKLQKWTPYWVQLTLENGLTNYGKLNLDDDIDLVGDVTNSTGSFLVLKNLCIEGDFHNKDGGATNVRNEVNIDAGTVYNSGTIFLIPADIIWAEYEFQNSGYIQVNYGSCSSELTFTNESTGVLKGCGGIHSDELINNQGLIQSFGGGLILHSFVDDLQNPPQNKGLINTGTLTNTPGTTLTVAVSVPDVNNSGRIEVNAGGGLAFDSHLVNEPNGTIELLGGTLAATTITQTADANFAGFGGIAGNVIIESNGEIKLTGPTNIVGDVEIRENATLEISDGTTLVTGQTTCNGTIHLKGGRIIPQGGFSGDCNIIWEPGLYTNIADFNLDGKVNIKDFALFADTWLWQTSWY